MWTTRWATPWRRPRLVHTSRQGAGRPEGLVHKSTGPSRIAPWTWPGHSFPSRRRPGAAALPCRHIVPLPAVGTARCRSGDVPGKTSRFLRRAQRRVHTLIRFGWPASAGRVTMMPSSGRCDVPGGGTHLRRRCRGLRRTKRTYGHTPCPGSPEAPSGRPVVQVSNVFLSGPRQDGAVRHQPGGGVTP